MKILLFLLLTISVAHGGSLEEYIHKKNPKLTKSTIKILATELMKYPKQVKYIVEKESTFNPKAKLGNCVGLMGVNSKIWLSHNPKYNLIKLGLIKSKKDLFTIKGNLRAGFWIFCYYKKSYRKYSHGH